METTTETPKEEVKAKAKVKIKLLRECLVGKNICRVGSVHTVDEEIAKEFCDRKIPGYMPFYGYMPEIGPLMGEDETGKPFPNPLERKTVVRAIRVA